MPDQFPAVRDFHPYLDRFEFDPTYGYSVDELATLQVGEVEPSDFAAFWEANHAANEKLSLDLEYKPSGLRSDTHEIKELYFRTMGDFRVGAWLCTPRDPSNIKRFEVFGHGYGGREAPEETAFNEEAIQMFVCAPGFHLSGSEDRIPLNSAALHVICGIHSRQTYILRYCAAAFWSAARVAEELHGGIPIIYRGTSFGGGIGTLMMPWEKRYVAAELVQPTFGYHSFRLAHRSVGSAECVRRLTELEPAVAKTLRYYDAVFAARHISVPTIAGVCAFDPAVPPPGQYAVANSIPERFRTVSYFSFGHCDFAYPGQEAENHQHARNFTRIITRI